MTSRKSTPFIQHTGLINIVIFPAVGMEFANQPANSEQGNNNKISQPLAYIFTYILNIRNIYKKNQL
jgi:hypothetical protein